MAKLLKVFGIAAIIIGALWIGQGTGLILWPASSFMLAQSQWAYIGAGLMVLGIFALWRAGKRR
ncbi:MAG: hypothetical protein B7Y89_05920 [Novosphingobium sp. 32-60-15]|uniref:hypothetical protein n=1 Tax=unclassified Novosphingobium TaxID=2644732 RepID=UPI000BC9FB92|nr:MULTISPECIES: hypothetical protein [unclassified Novosphingobium]OYX63452.1 MAG: hypothetical protein B7Y89_05920 [Novosphingobium sp. 32-60-15]